MWVCMAASFPMVLAILYCVHMDGGQHCHCCCAERCEPKICAAEDENAAQTATEQAEDAHGTPPSLTASHYHI